MWHDQSYAGCFDDGLDIEVATGCHHYGSRLSKLYALIYFIHSAKYYHYTNPNVKYTCVASVCGHFADGELGGIFANVSIRPVEFEVHCDGSPKLCTLSLVGYIDG